MIRERSYRDLSPEEQQRYDQLCADARAAKGNHGKATRKRLLDEAKAMLGIQPEPDLRVAKVRDHDYRAWRGSASIHTRAGRLPED